MPFRIEEATAIRATSRAILVEAPIFDDPEWIPQSQVHKDSEVWKVGDEGDLVVTDWFARQKEWSDA